MLLFFFQTFASPPDHLHFTRLDHSCCYLNTFRSTIPHAHGWLGHGSNPQADDTKISVSCPLRDAARRAELFISTKHDMSNVTSEVRWQARLGPFLASLLSGWNQISSACGYGSHRRGSCRMNFRRIPVCRGINLQNWWSRDATLSLTTVALVGDEVAM